MLLYLPKHIERVPPKQTERVITPTADPPGYYESPPIYADAIDSLPAYDDASDSLQSSIPPAANQMGSSAPASGQPINDIDVNVSNNQIIYLSI